MLAEWVNEPPEAVTVTVYMPAIDPLHVRVDVPDGRETLVGATEQVRLLGATVGGAMFTVPVYPFWLMIVIVDFPCPPEIIVTFPGLNAIPKFETLSRTKVE